LVQILRLLGPYGITVANDLSSYLSAAQRGSMETWVRKSAPHNDKAPTKSKALVRQFLEARLEAYQSTNAPTSLLADGLLRQRFLVAVLIELYITSELSDSSLSLSRLSTEINGGHDVDTWMVAFYCHVTKSSYPPPPTALALMQLLKGPEGAVFHLLRDWRLIWTFLSSHTETAGDAAVLQERQTATFLSKLACLAGLGRLAEAFDLLLEVVVEQNGSLGDSSSKLNTQSWSEEGE